jgi:hypothetical protein
VLLPPAVLLSWFGGFNTDASLRRPRAIVNAPFYPGGAWAVVADLVVGAVVVVVAGLAIHASMLRRTGYELPRGFLIGTLGVTGWAPYLGFHLLPGAGGAFLASLVVLRYAARPSERDQPERWPWRLIAAVTVVAVVVAGSYAVFHPLHVGGFGSGAAPGNAAKTGLLLQLDNSGFSDLTVLSIDAPAALLSPSMLSGHSLSPTRVPARKSIWLEMPSSVCTRNAIHVRYRLVGRVLEQPILLPKSCTGATLGTDG